MQRLGFRHRVGDGVEVRRQPVAGAVVEVVGAGPRLGNCHWSELQRTDEMAAVSWRLRAHNAGAPGGIVPHLPSEADEVTDSPDAEAMDAAAR